MKYSESNLVFELTDYRTATSRHQYTHDILFVSEPQLFRVPPFPAYPAYVTQRIRLRSHPIDDMFEAIDWFYFDAIVRAYGSSPLEGEVSSESQACTMYLGKEFVLFRPTYAD